MIEVGDFVYLLADDSTIYVVVKSYQPHSEFKDDTIDSYYYGDASLWLLISRVYETTDNRCVAPEAVRKLTPIELLARIGEIYND